MFGNIKNLNCVFFLPTAGRPADHYLALPDNEHLAHALHGVRHHALTLSGDETLAPAPHGGIFHALALLGLLGTVL